MARIGYARVSTIDQDLDQQLAKLKTEGCAIIRERDEHPTFPFVIEAAR